jgi:hypothetical protein
MFGERYCTEQKQQQVDNAQLKTELLVRTHRAVQWLCYWTAGQSTASKARIQKTNPMTGKTVPEKPAPVNPPPLLHALT